MYGIYKFENKRYFFKLSEHDFFQNYNKENFEEVIYNNSQPAINIKFKNSFVNRYEFESLGFGVSKKIYHGDLSLNNILRYKKELILIDNEFERNYSVCFQDLDYLINLYTSKKGHNKLPVNFYWWYNSISIYRKYSINELKKAFEERNKNGCDLSSIVMKSY